MFHRDVEQAVPDFYGFHLFGRALCALIDAQDPAPRCGLPLAKDGRQADIFGTSVIMVPTTSAARAAASWPGFA